MSDYIESLYESTRVGCCAIMYCPRAIQLVADIISDIKGRFTMSDANGGDNGIYCLSAGELRSRKCSLKMK